jgi:hypothetical protein
MRPPSSPHLLIPGEAKPYQPDMRHRGVAVSEVKEQRILFTHLDIETGKKISIFLRIARAKALSMTKRSRIDL